MKHSERKGTNQLKNGSKQLYDMTVAAYCVTCQRRVVGHDKCASPCFVCLHARCMRNVVERRRVLDMVNVFFDLLPRDVVTVIVMHEMHQIYPSNSPPPAAYAMFELHWKTSFHQLFNRSYVLAHGACVKQQKNNREMRGKNDNKNKHGT